MPDCHPIELDGVNAYLLETSSGRVLVDTGYERTLDLLRARLAELGGPPDLIVLTHAHPDHTGGAARLARETGAPVAMHTVDAALVRSGSAGRPLVAGPGCDEDTLARINAGLRVQPVEATVALRDGEAVPGFSELEVVHAPGHCAGQVVLLWPAAGLLLAADAAANRTGLGLHIVGEDFELAATTFAELAGLDFDAAAFGHGPPIEAGAAPAFRDAATRA